MDFSRQQNAFIVLIMTTILTTGVSFALKSGQITSVYDSKDAILSVAGNIKNIVGQVAIPVMPPPQKLSNPPQIIKAVYVTGHSAGSKSYISYLTNLFKNTEINSIVFDIKGSDGEVSYNSGAEEVKKYNLSNYLISDIDSLVRFFHNQNIYIIGRIAVFEDPMYSKSRPELAVYNKDKTTDFSKPVLWKDNNGLSWLDPASKDVWDYNISLARDALYHGFDEINFDYIRFPSDGNTKNMGFPVFDEKNKMSETINDFFKYLRKNLPEEKISADLFGLTTVNTDDMGIGQIIENAFENFDYVSPMVYPSHYADGFIGFSNPAEHPYEVVRYSIKHALIRRNNFLKYKQESIIKKSEAQGAPAAALQKSEPAPIFNPIGKLRPWLQDFDMGADYDSEMVKAQIRATEDELGPEFNGFMLWNPSNIYTTSAIAN